MSWEDIIKKPFDLDEFHEIVPLDNPNKKINWYDAEKLFEDKIDPLLIQARRDGMKHIRINSQKELGMPREKAIPLIQGWYTGFSIKEYEWDDDLIDMRWENKGSYIGGEG
tara:strand:+ start:5875 stop:6207 length:333 start_codon:yes stop_codon:yes gene_type:complete